jgi:hypothetical protein
MFLRSILLVVALHVHVDAAVCMLQEAALPNTTTNLPATCSAIVKAHHQHL